MLLRGGGHSPEDVMVLIALPSGPVLLPGDAVVHRDWLDADDVQRIASDPEWPVYTPPVHLQAGDDESRMKHGLAERLPWR